MSRLSRLPEKPGGRTPLKQRGVALVIVLWILILVTVATSAYALMARMDLLEANTLMSTTQARLAAEAGINLTAVSLRDANDEFRMTADGRPYAMNFDGIHLEVSVVDERGKLDINAADELTLVELFIKHGLPAVDAEVLAAATMDWRDTDEAVRVNGAEEETYFAAGLDTGPANRPFLLTEEMLQVLGMPFELYRQMEPGLTVYSRSAVPNAAYAPLESLVALPDISWEEAEDFIARRNEQNPEDSLGTELPSGEVVMARGRGLTYSIVAKATMPNGVWDQVEATIRLGGNQDGVPYRVLRWREGFQH
jgi:general secretion pathway protein K